MSVLKGMVISMARVKICGLSRSCDIYAVNTVKPDYIGFVFADSRRKVTPAQAANLRKILSPIIVPVGVFVNEPPGNILSIVREGSIDIIQLHGSEDEKYIQGLKMRTDKPIVKAITVQNKGDVQKWSDTAADYLLLDHKGGGTGEKFDWGLIGKSEKPYFLAGGLNPESVADAMQKTAPFAVDVSSGVETDGFKDLEKMREFVRRARDEH